MLKSEIVSPAMTYEALVDVDDAHLAELNIYVSNLGWDIMNGTMVHGRMKDEG